MEASTCNRILLQAAGCSRGYGRLSSRLMSDTAVIGMSC